MIKRTMQEWADFTGCYVTKCGDEYGDIWLHDGKPSIDDNNIWNGTPLCILDFFDFEKSEYIGVPITDAKDHDWRVLVEPKNKGEL